MSNQDSYSDFQVIIKTEPEYDDADDGYHGFNNIVSNIDIDSIHGYSSPAVNQAELTEDKILEDYYRHTDTVVNSRVNHQSVVDEGNSNCHTGTVVSKVTNNGSDTEDCNYGDMYQIKTEPIENKNQCFIGTQCQIKIETEADEKTSDNLLNIGLSNISTSNQSCSHDNDYFSTMNSNSNIQSLSPITSNKTENCADLNEQLQKSKAKNRRKRKETVRRLKVQSSDKEYDDFSYDLPLVLEDQTEDDIIEEYECPVCQKDFTNYSKFKLHQGKCLEKKKSTGRKNKRVDHQCEFCGKMFKDKRSLDRHGPVHSGVKPFQCQICDRAYTQKGHLQQHMKMHNDGGNGSYECEYCYKVSQRKDKYLYHLNFHARSQDTPYLCNACGSQFKEKNELTMHVTMHRNTELYFIREFKTAPTGAKYTKIENVRKDDQDMFLMKKPTYNNLDEDDNLNENKSVKERVFDSFLYVCQLCKKEFSDWLCFQEHLCRHTGEAFSLKCETCGKKFENKEDFTEHQEEHAVEGSMKCDICGKYLLSNTDMITHRNLHQVVSTPQRRAAKPPADGLVKMVVQQNEQNLFLGNGMPKKFGKLSKSKCKQGKQNIELVNEELSENVNTPLYQKVYKAVTESSHVESVSMFNHNFRYKITGNHLIQLQPGEEILDQGTSCHSDATSTDKPNMPVKETAMESNIKSVLNNTTKQGEFSCNICNMKFKKIHLLRLHAFFCGNKQEKVRVTWIGNKKAYECPICRKVFSDRRGIERHGPVHSGIKAYECTVCGRSYTQKGHLELHMKKHNDNLFERFECPFCFRISEKKDRFEIHKATHNTENPYTCNVCNNSVKSLTDLLTHYKTHPRYSFYYIENKFAVKSQDSTRKRDDLKKMPLQVFDSDKLQELSDSQLMLKDHEQLAEDSRFIFVCQICKKQFQSWEVVLEHIDRHFGLLSQFECETCNHEFDSIDKLKQHIDEHGEEFEYKCQVCMKYFKEEQELDDHFKVHRRVAQKRSFYFKQSTDPKFSSPAKKNKNGD